MLCLVALVLYWSSLAVGTHLPPDDLPDTGTSDKVLHFGAFLGLGWLLATVLGQHGRARWRAVPILLAYAAVDEWTQPLVGRECELLDWVCDAAGAVVGTAAVMLAARLSSTADSSSPSSGE